MKIGLWSSTAGLNNSTPPDGWPEGQAPSTVNDCARELMAQVRTYAADAQWFDHGLSPTYVNADSFTVPGNQLTILHAGRQLKLYDGGSTTYRSIAAASYTTVTTVSLDTGTALSTSMSSFAVAALSQTNSSLPRRLSASAIEANVLSVSNIAANTATLSAATIAVLTANTALVNSLSAVAIHTTNMYVTGNLSVASVGYATLVNSTTPKMELNKPGTVSYMQYINGSAWTLCTSDGGGLVTTNLLNSDASGNITAAGNITAFSDERLKRNWRELESDFIERLSDVKMGVFERIDTGDTQVGVSAQSLRYAMPEAVRTDPLTGYLTVAHGNAALAACVALAREVRELRRELNELRGR